MWAGLTTEIRWVERQFGIDVALIRCITALILASGFFRGEPPGKVSFTVPLEFFSSEVIYIYD